MRLCDIEYDYERRRGGKSRGKESTEKKREKVKGREEQKRG
jgi:hypothetical protein